MTKHVGLLVAGVISAAWGCSSSGSGGGAGAIQCSAQAPCPNSLICSQGYCVQAGTGGSGAMGGSGATGGSGAVGGSSGATGFTDPTQPGKAPPPPNGGAPGSGPQVVISVRELFLGETNRSFDASPDAWKEYGYNLDGILSTSAGTNHCKRVQGAPAKVQADGPDGIDNSYGANIMPIVTALDASPSATATQEIQAGAGTFLFRLANLDTNANQSSVNARFYHGAELGFLPEFDGSDAWPVVPELLTNPTDIDSSLFQFPASYVANGTWVSGNGSGTLDIALRLGAGRMLMRLTNPIVTMTIQPNGTVTDGIIAGVIPAESFIAELKKVAGSLDPSLCEGPTFESITSQIRSASDIMQAGANGDSNYECDGISIGLGFSGSAALLGGIAPNTPPQPDPCANP